MLTILTGFCPVTILEAKPGDGITLRTMLLYGTAGLTNTGADVMLTVLAVGLLTVKFIAGNGGSFLSSNMHT